MYAERGNDGTIEAPLRPTALPLYRLISAPTPVPKPTVAALIPLSLLEALRNLDTPVEDGMEELAEEIVVRRLGLSPTVAAQIQRYRQRPSAAAPWIPMRCCRCCGWLDGGRMRR